MNMSTLCTIKYMNRSYFSKARYMIGVGVKILGRTPVPKLPPSYPPPPPLGCYYNGRETRRSLPLLYKIVFEFRLEKIYIYGFRPGQTLNRPALLKSLSFVDFRASCFYHRFLKWQAISLINLAVLSHRLVNMSVCELSCSVPFMVPPVVPRMKEAQLQSSQLSCHVTQTCIIGKSRTF